jgi:hypothetical protein
MSVILKSAERCFLIPDGVTLPPGELEVETPGGGRRKVDAAVAALYEVSPAAAREHGRERSAVIEVLADLLSSAPVDRLLGGLGTSVEALERDPRGSIAAMGERLRSLAREALREAQERARRKP